MMIIMGGWMDEKGGREMAPWYVIERREWKESDGRRKEGERWKVME